jgi:hypothetical protein
VDGLEGGREQSGGAAGVLTEEEFAAEKAKILAWSHVGRAGQSRRAGQGQPWAVRTHLPLGADSNKPAGLLLRDEA